MSWILQRMLYYYFFFQKCRVPVLYWFNYTGCSHQVGWLSSSGAIKKQQLYNFLSEAVQLNADGALIESTRPHVRLCCCSSYNKMTELNKGDGHFICSITLNCGNLASFSNFLQSWRKKQDWHEFSISGLEGKLLKCSSNHLNVCQSKFRRGSSCGKFSHICLLLSSLHHLCSCLLFSPAVSCQYLFFFFLKKQSR